MKAFYHMNGAEGINTPENKSGGDVASAFE
jgi:hypothetical protein